MTKKERLKILIDSLELTPAEFSRKTGISKGNISDYLNPESKNQPGSKFVLKVKQVYPEINIDWLLTGEGPMILGESCKPDREYFQLFSLLKEHGFSENDALKLFENYVKPQSKQVFDLFIAASQGDKEALVKIRQYLDTMEMLFK